MYSYRLLTTHSLHTDHYSMLNTHCSLLTAHCALLNTTRCVLLCCYSFMNDLKHGTFKQDKPPPPQSLSDTDLVAHHTRDPTPSQPAPFSPPPSPPHPPPPPAPPPRSYLAYPHHLRSSPVSWAEHARATAFPSGMPCGGGGWAGGWEGSGRP